MTKDSPKTKAPARPARNAAGLSRRQREDLRHRQEIMEAAEQVFVEKGYVTASMEDVARKAEFGMGTLYKFFRSKADLYGALLIDKADRFLPRVEACLRTHASPRERVHAYFREWLDLFWEDTRFFRLFFQNTLSAVYDEKAGFTPELEERRARLWRRLERVFGEGVKAGQFHALSPALHAVMIEGVLRSYLVHLSQSQRTERRAAEEEAVWDFYARGALK